MSGSPVRRATTNKPVIADDIANRIGCVFNGLFAASTRTVMMGGGAEPLYLPATDDQPAQLVFTRDYASSALHEAAHWCIAGAARRRQMDYGYHYDAPPRTARQRQRFFDLELRCQAMELLFTNAARQPFRVSIDDLDTPPNGAMQISAADFATDVHAAATAMHARGLPSRAARLRDALAAEFDAPDARVVPLD
jgi:elongation factor P hydroxylase